MKTCVGFVVLRLLLPFILCSVAFAGSATPYFSFPAPSGFSLSQLDEFNAFINGCDRAIEQYSMQSPAGGSNIDYLLKRMPDKKFEVSSQYPAGRAIGDYLGLLGVSGAKIVRKVALIDGPANLRREPNGTKLKTALENGAFVLVVRELEAWNFVTDGQSTGWTHKQNLRPAPKTIYVRPDSSAIRRDGTGLDKAWNAWRQMEQDKMNRAELSAAHPDCPTDITHLEEDGLVPVGSSGDVKYKLFIECGQTKPWDRLPKAVAVQLNRKSCLCRTGNVIDGYDDKVTIVAGAANFKLKQSDAEEDCRVGRHFVMCRQPGPCFQTPADQSDCSMPQFGTLACPKECLTWKQK